jgi:hypothetical protein
MLKSYGLEESEHEKSRKERTRKYAKGKNAEKRENVLNTKSTEGTKKSVCESVCVKVSDAFLSTEIPTPEGVKRE